MKTMKKLLRLIGNYRLLLVLSAALAGLSVVLQLYIPNLFGDAIDRILGEGRVDFDGLGFYLVRLMLLIAAAALSLWLMSLVNNRLTYRTVRDLRARAIRQIEVLPLSYLDAHSTGDIVGRIIADTDQLSDGLLLGFQQLFSGVITIVVTLGFMLARNVAITAVVMLMTPVSFLVARYIAFHSYKMFRRQTDVRGRQTALINELVGHARIVKAFGHEERASADFRKLNEELRHCSLRAVFYSSLTNPSTRAVNNVIYALVALLGAFRIMGGVLTVGGLMVLLTYANQYMKPFNEISSVITELQNALACAARVFELIEAEPERETADVHPPVQALEVCGSGRKTVASEKHSPECGASGAAGAVEIRGLHFSYDPKQKLIENFDFRAEPGTTTAIVGPTGCGKTTLINLLMRFYEADRGSILIDGRDIREITRAEHRQRFGMVLQDTWLEHGTVRENIAFGKPEATDEEIIRAAREAHSWEFIRRLPEGLDTVIDDEDLSQGQKQLLCITRVMLVRPSILILDEATSSIDTRTEVLIQEAFARLMEGRTSFIVAHRLSTIRNADRILVMKSGRIIEQGTHEELMAREGSFYRKLYFAQFAGAEEE